MFLKPFRVKSNSQIKNSERKVIKNKIAQKFSITENDAEQIITTRDPISISKIITHSNNVVTLYLVKKRPMLFEYNDELYPTIYFLWHFPDLLPCFSTHPAVLPKLASGADLMLPSTKFSNLTGPRKYGQFEKGTLVTVNMNTNRAAIAIGRTALSSMDMYMAAGHGKCVNIIHVLHDNLCQMDGDIPVPELGLPNWLTETINLNEEESQQVISDAEILENNGQESNELITNVTEELEKATITDTDEMDKLLMYCLLKALKYSKKKLILPILTSNFYRLHIMNACPIGKNLDIKKTSYKKLNKFLNEMKNEGLLNVVEQVKGVESINFINWEHKLITDFIKNQDDISEQQINFESKSTSVNVEENYIVSAAVLPIFSDVGLRKGSSLRSDEVRTYVTNYVRKKKINSLENRGVVIPNKELADVIKTDQNVTWEELMQKIFSLMSTSYKISNAGTQVSGKGKVAPIVITVGSRSGNKKVTLVDNLELFGIRPADFGKECQHGVAASTSVTKPTGKKYEQLLIQGNQVAFVGNLLTGKYNVPKKYIRGLELAVKNKK